MGGPVSWLEELNAAVATTKCRVNGHAVPLGRGLDAIALEFREVDTRNAAVWWVGNGGSAAVCAHLSLDLLNTLGLRSTALTDAAMLSCMANDYGYPEVYKQPLTVLTRPGDLLVAISSSGRSENILRCADFASEKGLRLITLSALHLDNPLWKHDADVAVYLPCTLYGQAEAGHQSLLHSVIETMWLEGQSQKD
jgi:D-sedoheptulose 7-phosphate isomerase